MCKDKPAEPVRMWAAYKNERLYFLYFLIKEECSSHYDVETAEQDGYTCREVWLSETKPVPLDTLHCNLMKSIAQSLVYEDTVARIEEEFSLFKYSIVESEPVDPALLEEAANIVAAARVLMAANQIASITEWEKMDDVEAQLHTALGDGERGEAG